MHSGGDTEDHVLKILVDAQFDLPYFCSIQRKRKNAESKRKEK